jgi:hypothetical protein
MDRRKPLLTNKFERLTSEELTQYAEEHGAQVFAKIRIADALHIEDSGISNVLYKYALQAHFDFVVADEDSFSQFAIEFDGPHHRNDPATRKRDRKKNTLCKRLGMPLIRITHEHLEEVGMGEDVEIANPLGSMLYGHYSSTIGWLTDLWFTRRAFMKAREQGKLGYDAVWSWNLIGESNPTVGLRSYIHTLHQRGVLPKRLPTEYIAEPKRGHAKVVVVIDISGDKVVCAESDCMTVNYYQDPYPRDIARLTALNGAVNKLKRFLEGERSSHTRSHLDRLLFSMEEEADGDVVVLNKGQ